MKAIRKILKTGVMRRGAAVILLLGACVIPQEPKQEPPPPPSHIPVQAVEFGPPVIGGSLTLSMETNTTVTLTAAVKPDNASNKGISWNSSAPNIAAVISAGNTAELTAIDTGTAYITVISAGNTELNSPATATLIITVFAPTGEIGVNLITLNPTELSFTEGGEGQTLTAEVFPDDAADKTLDWGSSDPGVAAVHSSGDNTALVTPVAAGGPVTITARSAVNNTVYATCSVTVEKAPPVSAPSGWIGSNDRLRVDANGYLRNQLGQEVVLRGINLGGWMMQESWMCPVYGEDHKWAVLNTIQEMEKRNWSAEEIQALFDLYQDNWITEDDFNWLKAQGVNCLRISFWYRNFMSDDQGTWINNDNGSSPVTNNPGFKRLDWAFAQAAKRGMYVSLMMHGAVGGQSTSHGTGTLGKNELYTNPAYEEHTVSLWKAIASRYKDEAVLAVYDLLGEPNNNNADYYPDATNLWEPGSTRAIHETVRIYDRLYREVRAIDPHIICDMEAIWWTYCLPDPGYVHSGPLDQNDPWSGKKSKWENVMYSMHLYDTTQANLGSQLNALIDARTNWKVAIMVGEFNNDANFGGGNNLQTWAYNQYNSNKISWTSWTYKVAGKNQGNWSQHQAASKTNVNPMTHTYSNIQGYWGQTLRTFQKGTQTLAPGYTRQDMYNYFSAGMNHSLSNVFTNSNQSGFPVGGTLGPISAEAAKQ